MRVFLTGISGSLGTQIALLHRDQGDHVWGCARSEPRAVEWLAAYPRLATLFVCDARKLADRHTDVGRALPHMDRLYHCAAMKHVDLCETQPCEASHQNIDLTALVASACREWSVPFTFVSSDKACLPQGVYGAAKLLAERIVLQAGGAVVRLGNLIGSSGSVFALWRDAVSRGERITLTDPTMTRYFLPTEDAARFVADRAYPGFVAIPDPLRTAVMGDVATAVAGDRVKITGRRPGETQHQWLVAPGERVRARDGRVLLTESGTVLDQGMCSETAPRWDVGELLRVAGVG